MIFKLSQKLRHLLKFGFFVILAALLFTAALPYFEVQEKDYELDDLDLFGENSSDSSSKIGNTFDVINNNATLCLIEIIESMRSNSKLSQTVVDRNNSSLNKIPTMTALFKIMDILTEMEAAIIDPKFLFCILRTPYQDLLRKKNFNISNYSKPKKTFTFGVFLRDALKLNTKKTFAKLRDAGFKPSSVYTPVTAWMRKSTLNAELNEFPSHLFYFQESFKIHVVVFFERNNFLWHAHLDTKTLSVGNDLHYGSHSGAFETFHFVPVPTGQNSSSLHFYIPSNPHHFLYQIPNSKFLECNMSRAANLTKEIKEQHPRKHYKMSVSRFNLRTITVIRQLKSIFDPLFIHFWIWSGTMLGWYRECGVIPYTSDVDFAAWVGDVEDLEKIIDLIHRNIYVNIKMRMGMLEEALEFFLDCRRLRTDVFFMYKIENGSWCSGHSPNNGYYFRYYYPHFRLCSAELLGEKVLVPCETEKVIISEYGSSWSKPVSSWDYEKSIQNRGPNIYWSKDKLKSAYKVYTT